jgi:hypothetical protein
MLINAWRGGGLSRGSTTKKLRMLLLTTKPTVVAGWCRHESPHPLHIVRCTFRDGIRRPYDMGIVFCIARIRMACGDGRSFEEIDMKSNADHIAREVERLTRTIATLKPRSERRAALVAILRAQRIKQLKIETRKKKAC